MKSGGDLGGGQENDMDESQEVAPKQRERTPNRRELKEKSSTDTRNALKNKKLSIGKSYQAQKEKTGLTQINEHFSPAKSSSNIGTKASADKAANSSIPSSLYPSSPRGKLKQSILQPAKKSPAPTAAQSLTKQTSLNSKESAKNVSFKSRNTAHAPITGIALYSEQKQQKFASLSHEKGTYDHTSPAMTIKPKATHLEQIDEAEPEKITKAMQNLKSVSGVGG